MKKTNLDVRLLIIDFVDVVLDVLVQLQASRRHHVHTTALCVAHARHRLYLAHADGAARAGDEQPGRRQGSVARLLVRTIPVVLTVGTCVLLSSTLPCEDGSRRACGVQLQDGRRSARSTRRISHKIQRGRRRRIRRRECVSPEASVVGVAVGVFEGEAEGTPLGDSRVGDRVGASVVDNRDGAEGVLSDPEWELSTVVVIVRAMESRRTRWAQETGSLSARAWAEETCLVSLTEAIRRVFGRHAQLKM